MAPSYKEDDDQERQFDFDWDRDALPDYLKPFLAPDPPSAAAGSGAAATAGTAGATAPPSGAAEAAAPPPSGGLPDWLSGAGAGGLDFGGVQPFDFGAPSAAPPTGATAPTFDFGAPQADRPPAAPAPTADALGLDTEFSDIAPFDFSTLGGDNAGADSAFDFGTDSLPSWLAGGAGATAAAPPAYDVPLGRPAATAYTSDPAFDSPEMPDWLRTPATPAPAVPGPSPVGAPASAGGEFDFGTDSLPAWLAGGTAAAGATAAPDDYGDLPPFSFADAHTGSAPGDRSGADFGAPQPFSFGNPPAAAEGGGTFSDFDFSGVQPFDFGSPPAPVPTAPMTGGGTGAAEAFDMGGGQSFNFGNPAAAGPTVPEDVDDFIDFLSVSTVAPVPPTPPAPSSAATPPAPSAPTGGFDFDLGNIQPFSLEGLDLGAAGTPSPAAPSAPAGAFNPPGAPAWGRAAATLPHLPADPGLGDLSSLAGDDFAFEPFMFDQGGNAAASSTMDTPPAPAPALPFNRSGSGLPPGFEDLPDLQPFSFEGLESTTDTDRAYGADVRGSAPGLGRRAGDRPDSSPSYDFDDDRSPAMDDIHNFSWQRPAAGSRPPAARPPEVETESSIFAKARKRKEAMEQTLRQEAEARGEIYSPALPHLPPEEAAELGNWPNLDDDEAAIAAVPPAFDFNAGTDTPVQPFDFSAGVDPAVQPFDFSAGTDAPVQPFDFSALGSNTPPFDFGADMDTAVQPFNFQPDADTLDQPFDFSTAGSAADRTAQPFDLGTLGGEALQPFSFESAMGSEVQPFDLGAVGGEAVQPFSFESAMGSEVQPFDLGALGGDPVQPFSFESAVSGEVQPFDLGALGGDPVQPFDLSAFATPAPAAAAQDRQSLHLPALAAQNEPATSEPSAPTPVPTEPPGELLWSIPVAATPTAPPAATVGPAPSGGFGAETASGEFDFTGLPALDLGALELTPEERAYLMGEADVTAAAPAPALPDFAGGPELRLGTDAAAPEAATPEPFQFDPAAFARPELTPLEPAVAPALGGFDLESAAMGEEVAPFRFEADVAPIEPFHFAADGVMTAPVEPFRFEADVAPIEPFRFEADAPAAAPVEPFRFEADVAPIEPFHFEADAPAAAPVEPFRFEADVAPIEPFRFGADVAPMEPFHFEADAPTAAPVEPFHFEVDAPAAGPVEQFRFDTPAFPATVRDSAAGEQATGPTAESWSDVGGAVPFDFGVETTALPIAVLAEPITVEPLYAEYEPITAEFPALEAGPAEQVPPMPTATAYGDTGAAESPATPAPTAPAARPTPTFVPMPAAAEGLALAPVSGSLDDLLRHLRENPTDAAARLALAIGYEQRDDYTRSAEQYRELIKGRQVPTNILEIVTANLREMLDTQPENPLLHRLLGDAFMKQGLFQMAISQYNWLLTKGVR